MKLRIAGVGLMLTSLAYAVNVYAFTTATVNSAGSLNVTTTDQLLAIEPHGGADNPAGMLSRDAVGKVTLNLGSNGTASKGVQGDATYTYDNVIRVVNNNATAKDISLAAASLPAGVTLTYSVTAFNSTNSTCGTPNYAAPVTTLNATAGGKVCVSFKAATSTSVSAGANTFALTVSAA